MTTRVRVPIPIVVTGPAGSGKSKLAKAIADRAGGELINVGDLLKKALSKEGIVVIHRRDIGPLFLERKGQQAYVNLVMESLQPGVIIDGVRLAVALKEARARVLFFHVARAEPPGRSVAPSEPFAADVGAMQSEADFVADWTDTKAELDSVASAVLAAARMMSFKRRRGTGDRRISGYDAIIFPW